jgi:6-phosphogluconate dehydrogenase
MELGMVGLGRMGASMTQRLVRGGHRVVGFDPDASARARVEDKGAGSASSLEALVAALTPPRALSLLERLRSRDDDSFPDKLLSATRQFGGHPIKKE